MTSEVPIEDYFEDILGKAIGGLGIRLGQLAERSGVSEEVIQQLLEGNFSEEDSLRKLAPSLELDADSLVTAARKEWHPQPANLESLRQYNTPWGDMLVNAFLIWDPGTRIAAAFDTGTDVSDMLADAKALNLEIKSIFITHTHGDHVAELDTLTAACGPSTPVYANRLEPLPGADLFDEGTGFAIGDLRVHTLTTSGHSAGGTTYFIEGLKKPVAVVGDAMFAGSMGGGRVSYADALENNRRKILTLPDETILCPGHGPMSTIAEEKAHNPFFPEFK